MLCRPVVDYVPVPSSTSSSTLRTFLGKLDLSPTGKGFIPLESDRASAFQEVGYTRIIIIIIVNLLYMYM